MKIYFCNTNQNTVIKTVRFYQETTLPVINPDTNPMQDAKIKSTKTVKNEVVEPAIKENNKNDKNADKRPISPPFSENLPSLTERITPTNIDTVFIIWFIGIITLSVKSKALKINAKISTLTSVIKSAMVTPLNI